jgi:hypothetical protein
VVYQFIHANAPSGRGLIQSFGDKIKAPRTGEELPIFGDFELVNVTHDDLNSR